MSERLLSVGVDVGTTSTQMVVSELRVENRASSFAVPEMEIAERRILYKSPVYFTPLLEGNLVDGPGIRHIVEEEYQKAGIKRDEVDTGAIIITGETSRKENARRVLEELSGFAGDFVVATAGPELESILAAKGAGATEYSERTGKAVLHMDIGGGTSNLALIEDGKITATGCLNVGGRLLKFDKDGTVTYLSPVLSGLCALKVGETVSRSQVEAVAEILVQALEMAAGLRETDTLLHRLWTEEAGVIANQSADWCGGRRECLWCNPLNKREKPITLSFSGGVADCIETEHPWLEFEDMGPVLGQKIRKSRLCRGDYVLGTETIRATVIGAGSHSAQLSGSTVFCQNVDLPLKNLPVVAASEDVVGSIRRGLQRQEQSVVIALPGIPSPKYAQVVELAEAIIAGAGKKEVFLCLEQDMAKALGQALAVRMEKDAKILCLDRIRLGEESYLDVGQPVGPALPVVVKTLVLSKQVK